MRTDDDGKTATMDAVSQSSVFTKRDFGVVILPKRPQAFNVRHEVMIGDGRVKIAGISPRFWSLLGNLIEPPTKSDTGIRVREIAEDIMPQAMYEAVGGPGSSINFAEFFELHLAQGHGGPGLLHIDSNLNACTVGGVVVESYCLPTGWEFDAHYLHEQACLRATGLMFLRNQHVSGHF